MSNVAQLSLRPPAVLDPKDEAALVAVRALLRGMAAEARERILSELTDLVRPISAPRAGDVLGMVIQLLPRRPEWTVAELKQHVDDEGVSASKKEVYNALGYLTRKRHIRRIGYGRYSIDGIVIETSDDLGGENLRNDDEYRSDPAQEAQSSDLTRD